jgi:hypothetical protein
MLRGSCLCGGIGYEITGELESPLNCHCSMCRKATGAAFRSGARVSTEAPSTGSGASISCLDMSLHRVMSVLSAASAARRSSRSFPTSPNSLVSRWERWMTIPE